jgi:hypothetical protein
MGLQSCVAFATEILAKDIPNNSVGISVRGEDRCRAREVGILRRRGWMVSLVFAPVRAMS